jgi:hypothetical protein
MSRVGILTFSDGRDFLHQGITSPEEDIWGVENSEQHATWFAGRSDVPAENFSKVHLYPEEWYFPRGGAEVDLLAAPGEVTLAYLSAWTVSTGCRSPRDAPRSTTTRRTRRSCTRASICGPRVHQDGCLSGGVPFPVRGEPRSCGPW